MRMSDWPFPLTAMSLDGLSLAIFVENHPLIIPVNRFSSAVSEENTFKTYLAVL